MIALVITIIVLLILAGISISMLSGKNSILQRATDAKADTERTQVKEQAKIDIMAWSTDKIANHQDASLDDSKIKEILTGKEYVKEAKESSFIAEKGKYEILYSELYALNNQENNSSPEIIYEYANNPGVVEANSLIVGDIINYYYDKNKSPIQCEIIYNDEAHGLQAISLNSVKNVELGFGYELNNKNYPRHEDPKAIEAFKNGAPSGYVNTEYDKCRWSWNHVLATLNGYAQDYLGDMSINARCVGCPVDSITLNEDETTNMIQIGYDNIEVKDRDNNINGAYTANNGYTENISEDLKTLDILGIVAPNDGVGYWLCSRHRYDGADCLDMNVISGEGYLERYTIIDDYCGVGYETGLRLIFSLKSNIKVEKTGHQDFGAGSLEEP